LSAERAPQPVANRRVLVVEDEPELREVVCAVLEDEGYTVVAASDGRQAVDMACENVPDLIILDMGLPILSGEEVASTLREKLAKPPPILVMSAAGTVAERARRIGAANYIPKPFELDDLTDAVHNLLD
jgi:two-component system KDP operon response regulator KdpE